MLGVKDGWRILEQLQVLLLHFEERGFVSGNSVARAFNWTLLSALSADPQIIARSIRDPILAENYILSSFEFLIVVPFDVVQMVIGEYS